MYFNVNQEVVEMLQVLAEHYSLQLLLVVIALILRLPELIKALKK